MRLLAQDIHAEQPGIRAFPDVDDVFSPAHIGLAKHLLPLVSIDLGVVGAGLSGCIHAVVPLEPNEGRIGGRTGQFHGQYLAPDWLTFRLDEQARYELMGDPRFFLLNLPAHEAAPSDEVQALERLYSVRRTEYLTRKTKFRQSGELGGPLVTQLGGVDPLDGWPFLPKAYEPAGPLNTGVAPGLKIDGAPLIYICEIAPCHVIRSALTFLLVHYEPVARLVSLHYEWT